MIEWVNVNSTAIRKIGYDPSINILVDIIISILKTSTIVSIKNP